MHKWRVERSKSGKRWIAWRLRSKKKTSYAFITWEDAILFATLQAVVDRRMQCNRSLSQSPWYQSR